MRNRIGLCLIGMAGCLILTAVWAVLAVPGTALAGKPDKPSGQPEDEFTVEVVKDPNLEDPLPETHWAPSSRDPLCVAETVGDGPMKYAFRFPNPLNNPPENDPNPAAITTSTGVTLNDDISCSVSSHKGRVTGLQVRGRDYPGPEGILYVSSRVEFEPPIDPADYTDADGVFTLEVRLDNLQMWNTLAHSGSKKIDPVEAGTISIYDIRFTPLP